MPPNLKYKTIKLIGQHFYHCINTLPEIRRYVVIWVKSVCIKFAEGDIFVNPQCFVMFEAIFFCYFHYRTYNVLLVKFVLLQKLKISIPR